MGEVWEAVHLSNRRRVALKLLPPEMLRDPQRAWRFRQECELAAKVENLHVLPVYHWETDDPPFIAMRLVDGADLGSEIRNGPLPPDRAVSIVEQIASALEAAHKLNLRHRDVKPSNILLEEGARKGTDHAWLIDWGIAQVIDISDAPGTRTGQIVGTPGYIAPERLQYEGSDHRADVYSLAVVLYECLAGHKLFMGSERDQHHAHINKEPPALPAHMGRLRKVVAKGLAKSPDDRFQSASEFAESARRALPGSTDGPSPAGPHARPRSVWPARRRSVRLGVGGAVGLTIGLFLLWTGLIDAAMSAWIFPALGFAGALVVWGLYPEVDEPPPPGPSDTTRHGGTGGVPGPPP